MQSILERADLERDRKELEGEGEELSSLEEAIEAPVINPLGGEDSQDESDDEVEEEEEEDLDEEEDEDEDDSDEDDEYSDGNEED